MKNILICIYFLVLVPISSLAQNNDEKNYKIINTIWKYEIPELYQVRVDNFSELQELGEEYLKNDPINSLNTDDVTLISISKSLYEDMNLLMVNFQAGNSNIKQYTLKGYADLLKDYFAGGPDNDDENFKEKVEVEEINIDEILFYNVKKTTVVSSINYTYITEFMVGEIDGREFNITMATDNEIDRNLLMQSILESVFE